MNDRYRGLSTDTVAFASTSQNTRSASSPPRPSGVMVWPTSVCELSGRTGSVERHGVQAQPVSGVVDDLLGESLGVRVVLVHAAHSKP